MLPYRHGINGIKPSIGLTGRIGTSNSSGTISISTKRKLVILELFHAMPLQLTLQIRLFLLLLFLLQQAHHHRLPLAKIVQLKIHQIFTMTKKWAAIGSTTRTRSLSNVSSKIVIGSSIHLLAVGLVSRYALYQQCLLYHHRALLLLSKRSVHVMKIKPRLK